MSLLKTIMENVRITYKIIHFLNDIVSIASSDGTFFYDGE